MSEYKMVLMYNNTKTLNQIEKNEYFKVNESEFMSFEPQTTGYELLIPKDEIGDNINE